MNRFQEWREDTLPTVKEIFAKEQCPTEKIKYIADYLRVTLLGSVLILGVFGLRAGMKYDVLQEVCDELKKSTVDWKKINPVVGSAGMTTLDLQAYCSVHE